MVVVVVITARNSQMVAVIAVVVAAWRRDLVCYPGPQLKGKKTRNNDMFESGSQGPKENEGAQREGTSKGGDGRVSVYVTPVTGTPARVHNFQSLRSVTTFLFLLLRNMASCCIPCQLILLTAFGLRVLRRACPTGPLPLIPSRALRLCDVSV